MGKNNRFSGFVFRSHFFLADKTYQKGDRNKAEWLYERMFKDSRCSLYITAREHLNWATLMKCSKDKEKQKKSFEQLLRAMEDDRLEQDAVQAAFTAWAEVADRLYHGNGGAIQDEKHAIEQAKTMIGAKAVFYHIPEGEDDAVLRGVDNDRARSHASYIIGLGNRDNKQYVAARKRFQYILNHYNNSNPLIAAKTHYELGWIYLDGLGLAQPNKVKALKHFNKIIEQPEVDPVLTARAMKIIKEIEQSQPPQKKCKLSDDN